MRLTVRGGARRTRITSIAHLPHPTHPLLAPPRTLRTALPPLRPSRRALCRDVAKIAIAHRAESRRRRHDIELALGGGRENATHCATRALLAALFVELEAVARDESWAPGIAPKDLAVSNAYVLVALANLFVYATIKREPQPIFLSSEQRARRRCVSATNARLRSTVRRAAAVRALSSDAPFASATALLA